MNLSSNDNYQIKKHSINDVEQFAHEQLCTRFSNEQFHKWYCGVVHEFGIPRVRELVGRVEDAKYPGRLFTRLVQEERKRREARRRLYGDEFKQ